MKNPADTDFTVTRKENGVHVVFRPTDSHFDFRFLADAEDISRFGPLSSDVMVRHGKTGDTGDFMSDAVFATALRLAEKAAS